MILTFILPTPKDARSVSEAEEVFINGLTLKAGWNVLQRLHHLMVLWSQRQGNDAIAFDDHDDHGVYKDHDDHDDHKDHDDHDDHKDHDDHDDHKDHDDHDDHKDHDDHDDHKDHDDHDDHHGHNHGAFDPHAWQVWTTL